MRLNRMMPVTLALASGLASAAMLYSYLSTRPVPTAMPNQSMVVAAGNLDDSKTLTSDDVKVVEVLYRPPGAFARIEDLKGRHALVKIPDGQPILTSHLAPAGSAPALWNRIPPGKRAVTVAVNEIAGVGGFIKPGYNVDVIGVIRTENDWGSRTIAQDVPVLAIAQDDKDERNPSRPTVVSSATLLVSPQQAEGISLAGEKGRIRLVLRGPTDHKIFKFAKAASPAKHPAKPAPRPASVSRPSAPRTVTVYRQAPAQKAAPPAYGVDVIQGKDREVFHP